ncbi:uncharacterized protein LOC136026253 [Artemia franciscana]|uniref:uncharacterized protein LOC136026253 n=1 Tax=Artemia franciscana TaxID=6661 RepID=UPI0032DA312F
MLKLLCLTISVAVAYAKEARFVFLPVVNRPTITGVSIVSTTTTVTSTPFCFTVQPLISLTTGTLLTVTTDVAAPGNCRRRRWAFEDPVDEQLRTLLEETPLAATAIETSKLPEMNSSEEADGSGDEIVSSMENDQVSHETEMDGRFINFFDSTVKIITAISTLTANAPTKSLTVNCTPINANAINAC